MPETQTPLTVLYQDQHIVAIDKPAGLLVHRSRIDVHARQFALQMLRDQIGQPVFPAHRIDRPTSGVLLFALDSETARELSRQFEDRTITKSYTAIVRGHTPTFVRCEDPLIEKHDRIVDQKADLNKAAQPAKTEIEAVRNWTVPFSAGKYPTSRYSQVNVRPLTGRRHQIRRHLNHIAYPIVGDTTHGDRRHNRLFRERFDIWRLLLVAQSLTFVHPKTLETQTVTAAVGEEFERAIHSLDQYQT